MNINFVKKIIIKFGNCRYVNWQHCKKKITKSQNGSILMFVDVY
jgi:hypothetical protein